MDERAVVGTAAERADWLAELAADLDHATRLTMRLRPDGLVEVSLSGAVIGFVDHVAPLFVAHAGPWPAVSVEVAQRHSLVAAVDALRAACAAG